MVEKEHTEVIEGSQRLVAVDILDSEEAAEDDSIGHDVTDLYKEDGSVLVGSVVT